jgi:hypothetical protein
MSTKTSSELTALSHTVDSIGKLFSDSKTRHTWTMDVDGETHVIVVIASWNSGKFVVELNGYERFSQITKSAFIYSFKFRDRFFKVHSKGETLVLLIDTIPFDSYTKRAKANQAAMLKTYERAISSTSLPRVSSPQRADVPSHEPFSGDLAKRLGYVPQADEDDMFAQPVEVKSFVPINTRTLAPELAELTVVPDLIEFQSAAETHSPSSPDRAPTSPLPDGIVTPRDKILPADLDNPFAAFDELVAHKPTE